MKEQERIMQLEQRIQRLERQVMLLEQTNQAEKIAHPGQCGSEAQNIAGENVAAYSYGETIPASKMPSPPPVLIPNVPLPIAASQTTGGTTVSPVSPVSPASPASPVSPMSPMSPMSPVSAPSAAGRTSTPARKSLELNMGTWVMGILASILIFIGLCFFAIVVYALLNKPLRFVGMVIISVSILVAGILIDRHRRTPFSLSLTACGAGTIYLSILLTRLYFNYINNYVLYVLFLAWAIIMALFTRKLKSLVFQIIGYCGIVISASTGILLVKNNGDMLFLSIFLAACLGIYFFLDQKNVVNYIALSSLSIIFGFAQIIQYSNLWHEQLANALAFIACVFTCLLIILPVSFFMCIGQWLRKPDNNYSLMFCFLYGFQAGLLLLIGRFFVEEGNFTSHYELVFALVISLIYLIIFEIKRDVFLNRLFSICVCCALGICSELIVFSDISMIIGLSPIFIVLFLAGWLRRDSLYLYVGFGTVLLNILVTCYLFQCRTPWKSTVVLLFALVGIFLMMISMLLAKKMQRNGWKLSLFFGLQFLVYCFYRYTFPKAPLDYLWMTILMLLILFICSGYAFHWNQALGIITPKAGVQIPVLNTVQIYGEVALAASLRFLYQTANLASHWILLCLIVMLFIANFGICYRRRLRGRIIQCYAGIRLTVLILAAIFSFISWEKYAILGSVISLLLAILFILCGFKKHYPFLRIYGLILSLVSVLKLLLIDIQYDNGLVLICGFIGSGMLCFIISWIYNYIAKKY